MKLSRRELLRRSAVGVGVLAVGDVRSLFGGLPALAQGQEVGTGGAYGQLVPDPAGVLDLPPGFRYRIVSRAGELLTNGAPLPDRFDGTGAFAAPGGGVRLVRNHAQGGSASYPTVPAGLLRVVYDPGAPGRDVDGVLAEDGTKIDEYVSLSGTFNSCAGGVTPLGNLADVRRDRDPGQRHDVHQGPRLRLRGRPGQRREQCQAVPVDRARPLRP